MLIQSEFVDLNTPTGIMRTYVHKPVTAKKTPAILFYSEIFQQTGPIERAAKIIAGDGFTVLVPEVFHELNPIGTVLAYDDAGRDKGNADKSAKDIEGYDTDNQAMIAWVKKPIHYYATTFFPPKGFRTIHLDMHIAEDARLHKFDILSQRGLSKIADALKIIGQNQNKQVDIHQIEIFKNETNINELLARGDCMGCFYIESPAMRMLLQKLKVNNYLSLVAASSIIRPGVSQSGMMNEYILRHQNPEKVHQRANPVLLNIMPETYGVMVYQEDVIKVAHYYGGLSLAEADVLRRGMSGKSRSKTEFDRIKVQFFENGNQKGYREEEMNEVWRQIESFAGYAFAKGHSASYAVESYQSLFLRAYYPLEYLTAVINNGGGFYGIEFYLKEAIRLGARVYTQIGRAHV